MLLSQRKYAESRRARGLTGGTLEAVRKAIASKRITLVVEAGTGKLKIDPAIADLQWVRNTDIDQQLRGNGGVVPPQPEVEVELHDEELGDQDDDRNGGDELRRHKTAAAKADAQLKTMQALERAGALTIADDVEREDEEIARQVRNDMLAIADRLAQALDPGNPERARKLLDNEIKRVLRGLEAKLEQRAAPAAERETALQ